MNYFRRTMTAVLLALAALVSIAPCTIAASPTSVGIFFDVDATDCDASVPQGASFSSTLLRSSEPISPEGGS